MSELYSSASGSYETYLSERQVDQITTTIKQSTDIQMMGMAATTSVLGSKLDSMNAKLKVIGTGLYTAVSKNTLQIAASTEMLKKTFNEGFDAVNNRLDLGFAGISSEIGAMTAAMTAGFDQMKVTLDYWGNEICDKLDAIHDIVNNPLLTASRELYRRAVSNAKKQFFEEALEDIKGAVSIEGSVLRVNRKEYLALVTLLKAFSISKVPDQMVLDYLKKIYDLSQSLDKLLVYKASNESGFEGIKVYIFTLLDDKEKSVISKSV